MTFRITSEEHSMNLDRAVLAFAGTMVLISVALTTFVSPWWLAASPRSSA
jgi:hypothetical protein